MWGIRMRRSRFGSRRDLSSAQSDGESTWIAAAKRKTCAGGLLGTTRSFYVREMLLAPYSQSKRTFF